MRRPWERLPRSVWVTCDRTGDGWSPDARDKGRCGKQAAWAKRDTCDCGRCDMTRYACRRHKEEDMGSLKAEGLKPETLGNEPCQRNLVGILNVLDDRKLAGKVLSLLEDFRLVCRSLRQHAETLDPWMAERFLLLAHEDALRKIDRAAKVPKDCGTHWRCCLRTRFRKTMREIQAQKNR